MNLLKALEFVAINEELDQLLQPATELLNKKSEEEKEKIKEIESCIKAIKL
ncbi:MAG: hypothetical protein NWQ06_09180 [Leeuwenhoekiella sp.]|nr:hypothetical protein [Leeuwenhoekiella sp.]